MNFRGASNGEEVFLTQKEETKVRLGGVKRRGGSPWLAASGRIGGWAGNPGLPIRFPVQ